MCAFRECARARRLLEVQTSRSEAILVKGHACSERITAVHGAVSLLTATNGYTKGVDNICTACVLVALDGATQTKWRLISDEATALRTVAAPGSQLKNKAFLVGAAILVLRHKNFSFGKAS